MQQKIAIRKKALINRKKKYFEISSHFFYPLIKILKNQKKKNTKVLSIYYPSNYEVNVLSIFQLIKKIKIKIKILLPVIKPGNQMNFTVWKYLDPLRVNKFGMLEPCPSKKTMVPDFMLVPLLAFDKNNNRLGYGKGFYDKFLNKFLKNKKKTTTIGIAFSFQKYNKLPVSYLDVKLDYILTEKGLRK
jgi:5-formyltetrahydrofolate cyclo-ligase